MLQLGPAVGFDIDLPYYGAFDIWLCQIPTIAPYMPEGGGVGQHIDRCISYNICRGYMRDFRVQTGSIV